MAIWERFRTIITILEFFNQAVFLDVKLNHMSQRPKSITLDLAPVAAETTNRQLPRTISVSNGICSVESEEIAVIYSNFLNFFFIYSD